MRVIERVYEYLYLDDIGGDGRGGVVHSYGLMIELVREYNDGKSNIRDLWRDKCVKKGSK